MITIQGGNNNKGNLECNAVHLYVQRDNNSDTTGTWSEPHLEAGQHGALSCNMIKRPRDCRDSTSLGDT